MQNVSEIDLSVVSKIFISHQFLINPKFQSILENYFLNKVEQLNFSKKTELVESINNWCVEETKNNINEIISKDDIDRWTVLFLLNAIYFKAEWKYKFVRRNNRVEDFHIDENNKKSMLLMKLRKDLFYGELDFIDAKFAELPYKSSSCFKMVVIVPNKINGLAEIEKNLERINYESLSEYGKEEKSVEVKLPNIKFESRIDFKACLMEMGIVNMFDKDKANFLKMQSGGYVPMWADKIIQKALIEVNEEGTKAVAVTFQSMLRKCKYTPPPPPPNKTVYADRPFLAIIMYEKLPLFYARFTG